MFSKWKQLLEQHNKSEVLVESASESFMKKHTENCETIMTELAELETANKRELNTLQNHYSTLSQENDSQSVEQNSQFLKSLGSMELKERANESKHKEAGTLNTILKCRIRDSVEETSDNFARLLFNQSKNSHEALATLLTLKSSQVKY